MSAEPKTKCVQEGPSPHVAAGQGPQSRGSPGSAACPCRSHRLRLPRWNTVLPSAAAKKLNCAVSRSVTSWRWLSGTPATPSAPSAHCLPSACGVGAGSCAVTNQRHACGDAYYGTHSSPIVLQATQQRAYSSGRPSPPTCRGDDGCIRHRHRLGAAAALLCEHGDGQRHRLASKWHGRLQRQATKHAGGRGWGSSSSAAPPCGNLCSRERWEAHKSPSLNHEASGASRLASPCHPAAQR